jgi:DNA repair protein RecN (Recombination protein N)
MAAEIEALTFRVEDLVAGFRDYLNRIELDPQKLELVEARLDQLNKIKRKYGGSIDNVLDFKHKIEKQLEAVENIDVAIENVRRELNESHGRLCRAAEQLSSDRRRAAAKLAGCVEKELADLKMAQTRFSVDLQAVPAGRDQAAYLTANGHALLESGMDRAAFMIAPNVGEAIKPLAAIASGGELSRVVLALKAILAQNESLETIVFDEVDAGIGGGAADVVGRKLSELARHHQVLCITHLPQIARYGDHHFRIVKNVSRGRTRTTITRLSAQERVDEIARMLAGEKITRATRAHAREMLDLGRS